MSMGWKEREGSPIIKWADVKVGGIVEGELIRIRQVTTDFGDSFLLDMMVKDTKRTFQCPAVLLDRLDGVKPGTKVKIRYEGRATTKGNAPYLFQVWVWNPQEDMEDTPQQEEVDDLPF